LELNETYDVLVYADGVNLFVENINTINKNPKTLLRASKEVALAKITQKSKRYAMRRRQN
jgi:hypothetical protein